MQQTFEYYIVNPITWNDATPLNKVKSSSITRSLDADTQGSATIDVDENLGECYIRIYLVTVQNGVKERFPLGTFLVQTPSTKFDGKVETISIDAYTPLLELKEKMPPLGYSVFKNTNVMETAFRLVKENLRAPVVQAKNDKTLYSHFVADIDETWLDFITKLIDIAKYDFSIDEMGRIMFAPRIEASYLQPVWTYNDDNSSILYPDITIEKDLYGIPNVVEVVLSKNNHFYYSKVVNDDPGSPISTVSRGREIVKRITNPEIASSEVNGETIQSGVIQQLVDEYAKESLAQLSSLDCTISYKHGYCPVRIGDCVRLNYLKAGLDGVKAKVVKQTINCVPGCEVTEEAVFTTKLWRK